jgi:EAL domain-containing protein (putative c-di-GMP-specific phosphodiesterase class I)
MAHAVNDELEPGVATDLLAYIEATSDLVGVVDEYGRVLYLNDAARKRLGAGDACGLTTTDIFPQAAFARYYDEIRPVLLRGEAWTGQLPVLTASGEAFPMVLTIVAQVGPGGDVRRLVTHARELESRAVSTPLSAESEASDHAAAFADEFAIAVSQGLVRPHVQEVFDLRTRARVGLQGLARWERTEGSLLVASGFVDLLANTPIAPVVDLAVLRSTTAAAARSGLRAYVHLSAQLLADDQIDRYLNEIVDEQRIAPGDIYVEVAQSLLGEGTRAASDAARLQRELGVRTVLSGVDRVCEVNDIVDFDFDELRLARRLVQDAATDAGRARVVRGTVALAHGLGLHVVAAGVETKAECKVLFEAGCDFAHGDLFGPVAAPVL